MTPIGSFLISWRHSYGGAAEESGCFRTGGTMKRFLAKFLADESGATAIEYGLIAAGISLAIIAAVNGLGSTLNTNFNSINSSLK
jgi:pilus assembly protein Flp/PilA